MKLIKAELLTIAALSGLAFLMPAKAQRVFPDRVESFELHNEVKTIPLSDKPIRGKKCISTQKKTFVDEQYRDPYEDYSNVFCSYFLAKDKTASNKPMGFQFLDDEGNGVAYYVNQKDYKPGNNSGFNLLMIGKIAKNRIESLHIGKGFCMISEKGIHCESNDNSEISGISSDLEW